MRPLIVLVMGLLAADSARAETLGYAIYALDNGARTLLATDTRLYSPSDIDSQIQRHPDGTVSSRSSLSLADHFRVGIHLVAQKESDGFGLWIRNDLAPDGFSWEWFEHETGDTFVKLQGKGRLRVAFSKDGELVHVKSVEFLDDIELRFTKDIRAGKSRELTHIVVISQGSVLNIGADFSLTEIARASRSSQVDSDAGACRAGHAFSANFSTMMSISTRTLQDALPPGGLTT
jgi:hypothetical protein